MDTAWKAGLEDVVAARSAVCTIDGEAGRLYYRGYEIGDLAGVVPFEDVTRLLWFGELPDPAAARAFRADVAAARALPAPLVALRAACHGSAIHSTRFARRSRRPPRSTPTPPPATPRQTCARPSAS